MSDEDEAALLAELRAISNQSAVSRFDNSNEDDVNQTGPQIPDEALTAEVTVGPKVESVQEEKKTPEKVQDENASDRGSKSRKTSGVLPPWKRKPNTKNASSSTNCNPMDNMDIIVATPVKAQSPVFPSVVTINEGPIEQLQMETSDAEGECVSSPNLRQTSTFQGARGGDANDPELLALLKGVSLTSGSSDRFRGDEEHMNNVTIQVPQIASTNATGSLTKSEMPRNQKQSRFSTVVPPWKRPKNKENAESKEFDIVVATPNEKSHCEDKDVPTVPVSPQPNKIVAMGDESVPSLQPQDVTPAQAHLMVRAGFKQESTFQGDRGGDANDPELLALLKGVSSQSHAYDRFATNDREDGNGVPTFSSTPSVTSKSPATKQNKTSRGIPPWKLGKRMKSQNFDVDYVVDEQNTFETEIALVEGKESFASVEAKKAMNNEAKFSDGNFQKGSTFVGERGGAAQDEELLALLRGVSAKSGASDRFLDENGETKEAQHEPPLNNGENVSLRRQANTENPAESLNNVRSTMSGKLAIDSKPHVNNVSTIGTPKSTPALSEKKPQNDGAIHGGHGSFKKESSYQGERGGDAHDAELLALLRGVTSGVRDTNDVQSNDQGSIPKLANTRFPSSDTTRRNSNESANILSQDLTISSTPMSSSTDGNEDAIEVTKEDLPGAFSSTNWKIRKEAYRVLIEAIADVATQKQSDALNADLIFKGLDSMIPQLLAEKNTAALEVAMEAVAAYANHFAGASSSDRAEAIMSALFKGNGFTAPRPSSAKVVSSLVMKLIEVGASKESATVVVNKLAEAGFVSRKPKIVHLSALLVLEATRAFGAASLPLATVATALPKVILHSNKQIRDCGMEIVAEFCRALGSKSPMEAVIAKMQKAQIKDLDVLLEKQPNPTPIKIGLRCHKRNEQTSSGEEAFAAFQASGELLAIERYTNRQAVNVIEEMKNTEYESKLKLAKWSEKVGALDIALKCGGEKPYKLAQPSSSSSYTPLISQMKGLLTHTHFAVVTKAMAVLAMLAQGVGEKLYPNLRPLLPKLLQLSKDKKLTKGVASCLDDFFGNVFGFEHLLDSEAALPDGTDETKEKNALARMSALEYLDRCLSRGSSAGPRASATDSTMKQCAEFAAKKLNDSDATVRKAALKVLETLSKTKDKRILFVVNNVIDSLEQSNPLAHKSLAKLGASKSSGSSPKQQLLPLQKASSPPKIVRSVKKTASRSRIAVTEDTTRVTSTTHLHAHEKEEPNPPISDLSSFSHDVAVPSIDEAVAHCQYIQIPQWDKSDEDGGILAGLKSTKWQSRQGSVLNLAKFVECRPIVKSFSQIQCDTGCLLVLVKEHTRGFKESNMNVTRSIMELFVALCDYHAKAKCPFLSWAVSDVVAISVDKIADRKLSSLSKSLLLDLCVVYPPNDVLLQTFSSAQSLRAPAAHEEFLTWMKTFCHEFGSCSIGAAMKDATIFLTNQCASKNIRVRKAAFGVLGLMHTQLGPSLKATTLAVFKDPSLREEAENVFGEHMYDSSSRKTDWPKVCIVARNSQESDEENAAVILDLPKLDLIAELPSDCISRMGSKDGKTAWKARKAALEDVEIILKNSPGVIDASKIRPLVDLLRAMRERLSDSQSNLKPLAARLIGQILGSIEGEAQGKLGKVVYAPLINAAMNDNRKIMNDACMEALTKGTSVPLHGGSWNVSSLEPFVVALTSELEESEFKAAGIAGVLDLTRDFSKLLPDLDSVSSQRGETLGGRFASVLVDALSSSKADIRASAEYLLADCLSDEVFSMQTVKKCRARLVPAKQRSVGIILAKIASSLEDKEDIKTNDTNLSASQIATVKARSSDDTNQHSIKSLTVHPAAAQKASSITAPKQHSIEMMATRNEEQVSVTDNPLLYEAGPHGVQRSRAAMRSLTWPEYPEEPSGSSLFAGLKKAWSPLIPLESTKKLFPDGGIRKQDDAQDGFDIIGRAIAEERAGEGMAVSEQLGLILRWSVFVMSCKESSVGLTGLLEMLSDLISYLSSLRYEFSDSETVLFVPFLVEKASIAKGRFKDTYSDLIQMLKSSNIMPHRKFGPLVCVSVLESSSNAKARLIACQGCYDCVELNGLSGIGKKGVLVAAKALSEEKLPENKAAFLDLMVLLVSRMNNDVQRLVKICGASLSTKSRSLIEERMRKVEKDGGLPSPSKTVKNSQPLDGGSTRGKVSRLSRMHQSSLYSSADESRSGEDSMIGIAITTDVSSVAIQDELPALDLRLGTIISTNRATPTKVSGWPQPSPPSSLPRLKLTERTIISSQSGGKLASFDQDKFSEQIAVNVFSASSDSQSDVSAVASTTSFMKTREVPIEESIGAAASLRARLLKIREKNNSVASNKGVEVTLRKSSSISEGLMAAMPSSTGAESLALDESPQLYPVLNESLFALRRLIEKRAPLSEDDVELVACTDVLKNMHAAVSMQPNLAVGLDPANILKLRSDVKGRISEVITTLTSLIDFGFNCHSSSLNAGMSVPLLSVNLANLMAIFRSSDLATLVKVEDLTLLIRESAKALLDKRLATPLKLKTPEATHLDEATSTQMVRAINKLAVQAATGALRSNSLVALISLQEQLSLCRREKEDALFNSRLSRIVAKLMSRVIKAEESAPSPFDSICLDMESVMCSLDDTLVASDRSEDEGNMEGATTTRSLAKLVIMAILKAHGETDKLIQGMTDLGIDLSSPLGSMVSCCASELGLTMKQKSIDAFKGNGADVSALVSAVGSAKEGQERDEAVDALRQYRAENGDSDLTDHLENVSVVFRQFILEQLSRNSEPWPPKPSSNSMSERIKNLRSKLNATEAVIQSAVLTAPETSNVHMEASAHERSASSSRRPSLQAFRDRLAAANKKRSTTVTVPCTETVSPVPETSAGSRAAALRARLLAVKMQTKLEDKIDDGE